MHSISHAPLKNCRKMEGDGRHGRARTRLLAVQ